jgi:hypothetical protein
MSQCGHEETVSNAVEISGEQPFVPAPRSSGGGECVGASPRGDTVEPLQRGEDQRATCAGAGLNGVVVDEALGIEFA